MGIKCNRCGNNFASLKGSGVHQGRVGYCTARGIRPRKRKQVFNDDERYAPTSEDNDGLDKIGNGSEVEVDEEEQEWDDFTESYPNAFPVALDFPPLPEEGGGLLKYIIIQQRAGDLQDVPNNGSGLGANVAPVTRAELEFLAISQNW